MDRSYGSKSFADRVEKENAELALTTSAAHFEHDAIFWLRSLLQGTLRGILLEYDERRAADDVARAVTMMRALLEGQPEPPSPNAV